MSAQKKKCKYNRNRIKIDSICWYDEQNVSWKDMQCLSRCSTWKTQVSETHAVAAFLIFLFLFSSLLYSHPCGYGLSDWRILIGYLNLSTFWWRTPTEALYSRMCSVRPSQHQQEKRFEDYKYNCVHTLVAFIEFGTVNLYLILLQICE